MAVQQIVLATAFLLAIAATKEIGVPQNPLLRDAKNYYKCFPNAPNTVAIYTDDLLTCPANNFCNTDYLLLPQEVLPRPCIPVTVLCPYTCGTTVGTVIVNRVEVRCPKNHICDAAKKSCKMCVQGKCSKDQFTCLTDTKVQLSSGTEFECTGGQICNKDYVFPCTECIDPPKHDK